MTTPSLTKSPFPDEEGFIPCLENLDIFIGIIKSRLKDFCTLSVLSHFSNLMLKKFHKKPVSGIFNLNFLQKIWVLSQILNQKIQN